MTQVLALAPLRACPVGMGLMMWFMARGSGSTRKARDERELGWLSVRDAFADEPPRPNRDDALT